MNTLANLAERKFVRAGALLVAALALASCSQNEYSQLTKFEYSFTGVGLGAERPLQSCLKGNRYYDPNNNGSDFRQSGSVFVVTPHADGAQELIFQNEGENELVPADEQTALTIRGLGCTVSSRHMFENE